MNMKLDIELLIFFPKKLIKIQKKVIQCYFFILIEEK